MLRSRSSTAARHVADREIRAVGTIGGNLCATAGASAPRGDLQAPLLALGARVTSVGAGRRDDRGRRGVPRVRAAGGSCSRSTCRAASRSGYARLDRPHTHHYTMLAVSAVKGADGVRVAASGVGDRARGASRRRVGPGRRRVGGRRRRARGRGAGSADRRARVGLVPRANAAAARAARARTARLRGRR